ncbi:MAG: aminoacyl-tRNA hydrolase [Gammaproteobacteria bacterium]|nr:MAG: aminoacyl-tRNA hydrolase [Gammaproteobacteria bacterium]
MSEELKLVVGLGNPGPEHARDRHNAGYWFVDELARRHGGHFRAERRLHGDSCQLTIDGQALRLLKPTTFMNHSGRSVRAALDYYRIQPAGMLVVHDDLDLPAGVARFKRGGGHGGNNGLRDVIAHCGADFLRLRIGIGHPGHKSKVTQHVLRPPRPEELPAIENALDEAQRAFEILLRDGLERATTALHTATPRPGNDSAG